MVAQWRVTVLEKSDRPGQRDVVALQMYPRHLAGCDELDRAVRQNPLSEVSGLIVVVEPEVRDEIREGRRGDVGSE
jgi:hypothetical protein